MSVHKNDRKPNPLQALIEVKNLVNYTLDMTENIKLFNKGLRYGITQQITNVCYDIIRHIESANSIYVNSPESALDREQEQRNAIKDLATLHSFMTIAKERYHLPSDKIYKWSTQYEVAGSYLGAWYKKGLIKNREKFPFLTFYNGKMIYVSEQTSVEDVRKALEKLEEDANIDIINAVTAEAKLNNIDNNNDSISLIVDNINITDNAISVQADKNINPNEIKEVVNELTYKRQTINRKNDRKNLLNSLHMSRNKDK